MSESNGLPKGWTFTTIGEVAASIQYGHTASAIDRADGPRFLRITDIQNGRVDWSSVPSCEVSETDLPKYQLEVGDIVFARTGATTGKSYLIHHCPKAIFASYLIRLRMASGLNPSYLHAFFQTMDYWRQIEEGKRGIGQPNVNAKTLAQIEFPLAPLPEQPRIVAEIETQFTRLDASIAALQRVQANLKRYRASVLQAACEGRLVPTEAELAREEGRYYEPADQLLQRILQERRAKWESDQLAIMKAKGKVPKDDRWKSKYKEPVEPGVSELPELPEGWVWSAVEQLAAFEANSITDGPFGSNLKTSHYTSAGPRVIRLQNIGEGVFIDAYAHISQEHYELLAKHRIEGGDLVIATLGERPPRACIIPSSIVPAIVKADCIRFKPEPRLASAKFLNYTLNAKPTRDRTASIVHGVGRPRLNLGEIKALSLPLPPLAEQNRIIAEVERRLSVIDELEATIDANLKRADRLRQSILKRAFEGKLVPQDPTDEPANVLLERIQAERDQATEKSKATRKTKPRKRKIQQEAAAPIQGQLSLGFGE